MTRLPTRPESDRRDLANARRRRCRQTAPGSLPSPRPAAQASGDEAPLPSGTTTKEKVVAPGRPTRRSRPRNASTSPAAIAVACARYARWLAIRARPVRSGRLPAGGHDWTGNPPRFGWKLHHAGAWHPNTGCNRFRGLRVGPDWKCQASAASTSARSPCTLPPEIRGGNPSLNLRNSRTFKL